jgi:adenylate cyclase
MKIVETLKRRKRRFYKSLALGIAMSIVLSVGSYLGYTDIIEAKALDFLFMFRGQQRSPEIVLVQIDDQAFSNLGEKQPLPRSYLASLIEVVGRGGAKVIGLDVELKVPTDSAEDRSLLTAIQGAGEDGVSKVVPVYVIRPEDRQKAEALYKRSGFFDPRVADVAGFANAPVDADGFIRQVPLAVRASDGKILPSLALAVLARHAGYNAANLESALMQGEGIQLRLAEWDRFGGKLLPDKSPFAVDLNENLKINFAGGQGSFVALPSDPLAQLARANVALAADNPFQGKIVLIGASFQESRDFYPTPYGLMSGLEIHANIIHTILSRSQIQPGRRVLALSILLIFAFVSSLFLTLLRPTVVTILSLVAIPLVLVPLSYVAFAYLGLWVDFVVPLVAIRWGALAAEYLESRHVRKSLGQYVDREVANRIVDQEESLGGEKKEVSVFFTDVRNYTTLCEGLLPENVVGILNELFAMMGKVIARHNGCIVDFIGDAVLAVFGAPRNNPNHVQDAVKTALEVQDGLDELNARWEKRGIPPLQIGVGIHMGEVLAGIVGSGQRKKFGVTGDTVNTGSRVEALNKEFGTSVLITRETLDRLNGKFAVRRCGEVQVKGRDKPVEVFELLRPGSLDSKGAEVP